MKTKFVAPLLIGLLWTPHGVAADPPAIAGASQDGIVASLAVDPKQAAIEWHFTSPPPAKVGTVTLDYNGRPLTQAYRDQYPSANQTTAVIVVVDVSGGAAQSEAILHRKTLVGAFFNAIRPYDLVGLYSTTNTLSVARSPDGKPLATLDQLDAFGISEIDADLAASLSKAIAVAKASNATRRGVFLFTDGQSATAPDYQKLAAAAKDAGASLYVYLDPGRPPRERDGLKSLALETGGTLYDGATQELAALADPFALLDSGATVSFPLSGIRKFFWESDGSLTGTIDYGDRSISLAVPVTIPDASLSETVAYLWEVQGRTGALVLAGVGWALALVFMPFARIRWPRRAKGPPAAAKPAVAKPAKVKGRASAAGVPVAAANSDLQPTRPPVPLTRPAKPAILTLSAPDSDFSATIELSAARYSIGRARDNAIVVPVDTVSSYQAVLTRDDGGRFSISNLSTTNPTTINGQEVQFQTLEPGDTVGLGTVQARIVMGTR